MLERLFHRHQFQDPPFIQFLFGNVFMAPLFTLARVYVGWQFLQAGYHKVKGDGWLNQDGSALQGFWQRAVAVPATGTPPIKFDWYRSFLQYMLDHHWYTWFAWIIAFGETIAGIAMIIGALTALAALGGAFMNFNFMLAGSASTNPVLFALAILLVLGWKVSGYIGVDRWLLPMLGTPWESGSLFRMKEPGEGPGAGPPPQPLPTT